MKDLIDKLIQALKTQWEHIQKSGKLPPGAVDNLKKLGVNHQDILKQLPSSDDVLTALKYPFQKPERPMKYPYTFSAKLAQFPYKLYFQRQWIWRYYLYGIAASVPIFYKLSRVANSKANKAKWREIRRKEKEEYKHRFDY